MSVGVKSLWDGFHLAPVKGGGGDGCEAGASNGNGFWWGFRISVITEGYLIFMVSFWLGRQPWVTLFPSRSKELGGGGE